MRTELPNEMHRDRPARVVMVQGTSSHAGKSLLVTALCRIFRQDGFRTAPFKALNMSLNSAITPKGEEIGRSQATQAEAAGTPSRVEMNPVLIKPAIHGRTQVVVMGKPLPKKDMEKASPPSSDLWDKVVASLQVLRREFDIVVIEGSGSPVEINLKQRDIANMRVALHARAPVLLIGDIDRGGVFAQMVGTMALLEPDERRLVKGLVVNKLRGNPEMFSQGTQMLEERANVPVAGVLPFMHDLHIPEEDAVGLPTGVTGDAAAVLDIAVMRVPHIANFDDFDPLSREAGVRVRFVNSLADFGDPDLLILPGSKATVSDLDWLRFRGLDRRIIRLRTSGTPVMGLCAGFQMLGRRILDPEGVESSQLETNGLGLLPTTTAFATVKTRHQAVGVVQGSRGLLQGCEGKELSGYESHMGETTGAGDNHPFMIRSRSDQAVNVPDGALDQDGLTLGTYLHGLFHNPSVRRTMLENLARRKGVSLPAPSAEVVPDAEYDRLAFQVRKHLDMELVYRAIGEVPKEAGP